MKTYRYFMELSFTGANYCGWQIQPGSPSVQQEIEEKLNILLKAETKLTGAGRTDTGVHAMHYTAHFDCCKSYNELLDLHLVYKLNRILPHDIAIQRLFQVKQDAHARFSAQSRSYIYYISRKKDPFWHQRSWLMERDLDIDRMNEAAKLLFLHNDFKSFSKSNTQVSNYHCTILEAKWHQQDHLLAFTIRADRFLRNMVRALTGTLIDVGLGKITPAGFNQIIESKNRSDAGFSVPGYGLYFMGATYSDDIYLHP